jgi:hypothetical protein
MDKKPYVQPRLSDMVTRDTDLLIDSADNDPEPWTCSSSSYAAPGIHKTSHIRVYKVTFSDQPIHRRFQVDKAPRRRLRTSLMVPSVPSFCTQSLGT